MARFEFNGFESLQSALDRVSLAVAGPAADDALTKGGELLAEYFVGGIEQAGLVDTGELAESIKADNVKKDGQGKYVTVHPTGTREDGKRNAEVGAYHEYGVKRESPLESLPATHWMSNTVDDTADEIADVMKDAILAAIDEAMG